MFKIIGYYYDREYLIAEFNTLEEAEEFVKHPYVLYEADESEENEEQVIMPEEMFIEKDWQPEEIDDLPF